MTGEAWLTIMWDGTKWVKHTPLRSNFHEHMEEFNALVDTAWLHEPPIDVRIYKSIHNCWLEDIANWETPFESDLPVPTYRNEEITIKDALAAKLKTPAGEMVLSPSYGSSLDQAIADLSPNDRKEFRKFSKYLAARQKYGDAVLLKRRFWRKYLGLDT